MKKKMRYCPVLFALLLLLSSFQTRAEGNAPVKTKIREVCVFTSGARIVSEGELQLQKGSQEILIDGISATVAVELLKSSDGSLDKETGILRWNLNLKGGDSSTQRFRFKVKYPRNMVLDYRF
jgi:hypothetical protein